MTLPDGTVLDAAGSDALLQHQVYVDEPDPTRQDAVFAAAAVGVVDALLAPTTDPVGLGRALLAEADARRVVLWSPDAATQDLVRASGTAGDLLADPADVGVFLNDATSSKMQWFLRSEASVVRRDDGTSVVRVDLTSTAPAGGAGLPAYVTGSADELGLPPGGQRVQVMVHGPVGDGPSRWLVDGEEVLAGSGVVAGRGVGVRSVDVAPGRVVRVEVELAHVADLTADRLVTTPSVTVLP